VTYGLNVGLKKHRVLRLPDGEMLMILRLLVLTQYRRVTERQTQRRCLCRALAHLYIWLHGTAVERRSLTGEVSPSCARPAADGWLFMWVNYPLSVSQPGRLKLSSFRG